MRDGARQTQRKQNVYHAYTKSYPITDHVQKRHTKHAMTCATCSIESPPTTRHAQYICHAHYASRTYQVTPIPGHAHTNSRLQHVTR
jgi:ribosomal protein L44E